MSNLSKLVVFLFFFCCLKARKRKHLGPSCCSPHFKVCIFSFFLVYWLPSKAADAAYLPRVPTRPMRQRRRGRRRRIQLRTDVLRHFLGWRVEVACFPDEAQLVAMFDPVLKGHPPHPPTPPPRKNESNQSESGRIPRHTARRVGWRHDATERAAAPRHRQRG